MTRDRWAAAGVVAVLALLYASPLWTTYYAFDEASYLFPEGPYPLGAFLEDVRTNGWRAGLWNGRPVSAVCWYFFRSVTATYDTGLFWIRVGQLVASALTALLFFALLRRRDWPAGWAAFLTLLVWSHPTIHVYHAIAMAAPYWLGMWASVLACLLVLRTPPPGAARLAGRLVGAALLYTFAWWTFQGAPFFGLVPAVLWVLTAGPAEWRRTRRLHLAHLGVFLVAMAAYPVAYQAYLRLDPAHPTYHLASEALALLEGRGASYARLLHPDGYLPPFEWWNYPVSIPPLSQAAWETLTGATALVWLATWLLAGVLDARRTGTDWAIGRHAVAAVAVALTFLPLPAAGFTGRTHVYVACVPAVVVSFAWAVRVLAGALQPPLASRRMAAAMAVAGLVLVCLGARGSFERGFVQPNARFYQFVLSEIDRQQPRDADRIVVVNADQTCPDEPCRGLHARRMSVADRTDLATFYQTLVRRRGGPAALPVQFTRSLGAGANVRPVVIDTTRLRAREGGA